MAALHRPICPEGRAANGEAEGAACPEAARPFVLAATILASAMAFIDGTVVSIALPAIQTDLESDFRALQWVVNGYTLMLGALILVGGGLGDRMGRRKLFLVGVAVFALASVLCAAASTVAVLIVGRIVQGIGAAALVPQSLAIISASFPKERRGKAIGTWAAASAVTMALGPPLGGFLIDGLTWRAAFWINIPLAAAALWLTLRYVPESRNEEASGPIDCLGAAVATPALGALTLGLTILSEAGGSRAFAALCLAVGVVGIPLFLVVERRAANPVMPPKLFRSRMFAVTNLVTLFLYGALAGALFLIPFDLIEWRGLSASEVGLTLLPMGLVIGLFSRMAGAAADRGGVRPFLAGGALLVAIACGILALHLENLWVGVLLPVMLFSVGMAAVVSPLTTAVMNSVPDAQAGAASGVSNAASRLAGLIAVAATALTAGLVFAASAPEGARFGVLPPPDDPSAASLRDAFSRGYATAMAMAALWAFAASLCAWFLIRDAQARPNRPVDRPGRSELN